MGVRESLTLDHFYFNVSADEFDQLLKLTEVFRAIKHDKVVVTNDSWEGLYLYSRPSSYLEILRARRVPGFLGLCLSPAQPHYCDASKILTELPLTWHTFSRKMPDGVPWFDAHSLDDGKNDNEALFTPWVMKYFPRHSDYTRVSGPRSVDRFRCLRLKLGRENLNRILYLAQFMPVSPKVCDSHINLEIPDRDGFRFMIEMELVPGNARFQFQSLTMDHCDPERFDHFRTLEMGEFALTANGKELILSKRA